MNHKPLALIILARAGSKRLPGKNRQLLGARPLYRLAVEAALDAGIFSPVVLSTDDAAILRDLENQGQVLTLPREPELAQDSTVAWEVCAHLLKNRADVFGGCEAFCLITPCHPLRTATHLVQAVRAFQQAEADALVSMTRFPFPPELALRREGPFIRRSWTGPARKDEHAPSFYPNGAITICRVEAFLEHQSPYTSRTVGFELPWPHSLDIDSAADLDEARALAPALLKQAGP
jgi:N-acylneuraminate cytidylyltransferase